MNRPHRANSRHLFLTLDFFWACLLVTATLSGAARAQDTPAPPTPTLGAAGVIPSSLITSVALAPEDLTTINNYVAQQVALLSDPANMSLGRNHLIASSTATQPGPSAAFSQAYDSALNGALLVALGNSSPDVRLNAAIIAAKATFNAKTANVASAALAPLILKLINDRDDATCLWAIKAAGNVVVPALAARNPALLNAIVPAVIAHGYKGPMVDEAYQALDPSAAAGNSAVQQALIGQILDLFAKRVAICATQVPDAPSAERWASLFLSNRGNWTVMNASQQLQTMQLIVNTIALISQHAQGKNLDPDLRAELIFTVNKTAEGIDVVSLTIGDASLQAAARNLEHSQPPQFLALIPPLVSAVQAAKFNITAPPTVKP